MTKSYLFIYSNKVGSNEEIKGCLNRMSTVTDWRTEISNVFFVVSTYSAHDIAKEFEGIRGSSGRFVFVEYNTNAQGRLTSEAWYLLKNKCRKPKD